jgi:hypothetical protein
LPRSVRNDKNIERLAECSGERLIFPGGVRTHEIQQSTLLTRILLFEQEISLFSEFRVAAFFFVCTFFKTSPYENGKLQLLFGLKGF